MSGQRVWECLPPWNSLGEFNYLAIQGLEYSETVFRQCLEVVDRVPPQLLAPCVTPLPRNWEHNEFLGALLSEWERHIVSFDNLSVTTLLEVEPPLDDPLSKPEAVQLERYLKQRHLVGVLEEAIQKLADPRGFSTAQTKRLIPIVKRRWIDLPWLFKNMLATVIAHRTGPDAATGFLNWVIEEAAEDRRLIDAATKLLTGLNAA